MVIDENKSSFMEPSLSDQLNQALEPAPAQQSTEMPQPVTPEETSALSEELFSQEEISGLQVKSASSHNKELEPSLNVEIPVTQPESPQIAMGSLDFLDDSKAIMAQDATTKVKSYNTPFYYAILGTVVFSLLAIGAGFFNRYLSAKALPNTESPHEYVQATSDYYNEYGQLLGLFNLDQYQSIDLAYDGKNQSKNLISADGINYPQKKDILQSKTSDFGQKTIAVKKDIKTITDQINKDGFFPEELVAILKENNSVSSIQRSLLSLEIVKFSSAMKVFSLMDVFLTSLSTELALPKTEIKQRFADLLQRGENDVKNYLNYCYNNPYEPANCNVIGDFDIYYRINNKQDGFDPAFFKTMMDLIDRKLENAQLPSFALTFNDFDSKNSEISFSVEVNTLKEDEYALIREGIKSPHIFVVSELIKMLKQSTFIMGDKIDTKNIQVEQKEEELGDVTYKYNSSNMTFKLPIQKNTKREIFDYVDIYTSILEQPKGEEENNGSLLDNLGSLNLGAMLGTESEEISGGFVASSGENLEAQTATETSQDKASNLVSTGAKVTSGAETSQKVKIKDSVLDAAKNSG